MIISSELIPAAAGFRQEIRAALTSRTLKTREPAGEEESLLDLFSVYCFSRVGSTMDVARAVVSGEASEELSAALLGGAGAAEGREALVVSAEQSKGRGRDGRSWFSPPGTGLYATFCFFPGDVARHLPRYSMVVGLAICRALEHFGVEACVKRPNDVLTAEAVGGVRRKLAGVLIESSSGGEVVKSLRVGIGLNLNQRVFPEDIPAASMAMVLGREVCYGEVLAAVCAEVVCCTKRYFADGFPAFAGEWYKRRSEPKVEEGEDLDAAGS